MKVNKKIIALITGTILFTVLVLALNQFILVEQFSVDSCFDFDGKNETVRSSAVYENGTDWGYLTDDCLNNQNLTEYACFNSTVFQKWKVICMNGCGNGTCLN